MTDPSRITAGEGARRPPRSWLHTDAPTLDLTGLWRFRLLPGAPGVAGARDVLSAGELPEAMADPEYDDSSWDEIPVPAHWVLVGDGRYGGPMYTNTQYPFPVDPPHVPDQNPTGDYRRTIDLPDSFAGAAAVVLRFEGLE
ncbi:MAG: sugar-binding domain-containing protein, partial [Candidatus Phosphoribacter sp.]